MGKLGVSHWQRSRDQLRRCVPWVFAPGTCLYVGASHLKFPNTAQALLAAGRVITILEIWEESLEYYRQREEIAAVVAGDLRRVTELGLPHFDLAFWWHGPEHVRKEELAGALAGLEQVASRVVTACPLGWTDQREQETQGNPYQAHLSGLLPKDFQALGYQTDAWGKESDWNNCNLLAWK